MNRNKNTKICHAELASAPIQPADCRLQSLLQQFNRCTGECTLLDGEIVSQHVVARLESVAPIDVKHRSNLPQDSLSQDSQEIASVDSLCDPTSTKSRNDVKRGKLFSPFTFHLSHKQSAFTLAEMMIVLLVLSLITAAFLPIMTKRTKSAGSNQLWSPAADNINIYMTNTAPLAGAIIGTDHFKDSTEHAKLLLDSGTLGYTHILFKEANTTIGRLFVDSLGNTGFGNSALIANSGSGNTAIGYQALSINTTGKQNVAIGSPALVNNNGDNNVAIGYQANNSATGNSNTVAVGYYANCTGDYGTAIGYKTVASSPNAIAIGSGDGTGAAPFATTSGACGVAIGSKAQSTGDYSVALGQNAAARYSATQAAGNQGRGVAIGASSSAFDLAVAIGRGAAAYQGYDNIAIGDGASSTGGSNNTAGNSIAIGGQTNAGGLGSIAIGGPFTYNSKAYAIQSLGANSVAIGSGAGAKSNYEIAIGCMAAADSSDTIAIGTGAGAPLVDDIAIGRDAVIGDQATTGIEYSICMGSSARVNSQSSIAMGKGATIFGGNNSVAIGKGANVYTGGSNIAIGDGATTTATKNDSTTISIAIGKSANCTGNGIAIGQSASSTGNNSTAIGPKSSTGSGASATGDYSTALGDNTVAAGDYSTALGHGAQTSFSGSGSMSGRSVAIGPSAIASSDVSIAIGRNATTYNGSDAIVIGDSATINTSGRGTDGTTGSIAIGTAANASYSNSVAIGNHAATTGANQFVIGNTAPNCYIMDLIVSGSVGYYGSLSHLSDRRLKNVGENFNSGLDKIRELKVYNYTFKKDKKKTPQVGVMAQDLQKVFPNAVTKDKKGYLMIRQEDMFYAMLNSIKQLDVMVQGILKDVKTLVAKVQQIDDKIITLVKADQVNAKKIQQLETKNKALEARLARLEKLVKSK